jgi:hypothetical protein
VWNDLGALLRLCPGLQVLDFTLDAGMRKNIYGGISRISATTEDVDNPIENGAEAFCSAIEELSNIKHLVIRKNHNVYLTHAKPQYVLSRIATAIHNWQHLVRSLLIPAHPPIP